MTADPLPGVALVRKLRWSRTVSCGHHVLSGQAIVHRGGRWICLNCALDAIKTKISTEGKRP